MKVKETEQLNTFWTDVAKNIKAKLGGEIKVLKNNWSNISLSENAIVIGIPRSTEQIYYKTAGL